MALGALFFATLCASDAAILELGSDFCAGCVGLFDLGSLCNGPAPNYCSGAIALTVALLVVATGLILLFAIHATSAFRLQRGMPVGSLLSSKARSRRFVFQVLALTLLTAGAETVFIGLVMSLNLFVPGTGCADCSPPPYALAGLPRTVTLVGVAISGVGSVLTAVAFRNPQRLHPTRWLEPTTDSSG